MTREDYLHAVSQLIRNTQLGDAPIKFSILGNLIPRATGSHWSTHGFNTLTQLLQELHDRNEIRIEQDAHKHSTAISIGPVRPDQSKEFRRVRKEIWGAFISAHPPGARFMHRTSGTVVLGQLEPPQPAADWIPVPQIAIDVQKGWARELVGSLQNSNRLSERLVDPRWYVTFPDDLRAHGPDALPKWNQMRSARVAESVDRWANEHSLASSLVFDPHRPSVGALVRTKATNLDWARNRVLKALGMMSTTELLEIPIPAKYLLDVSARDNH